MVQQPQIHTSIKAPSHEGGCRVEVRLFELAFEVLQGYDLLGYLLRINSPDVVSCGFAQGDSFLSFLGVHVLNCRTIERVQKTPITSPESLAILALLLAYR